MYTNGGPSNLFDTLPNNDMMPSKHSQALIAAFTEMVSTCPWKLGFLIKSQPFEPKNKYAELTRWAPENQLYMERHKQAPVSTYK